MDHVGIDLHKRQSQICALHADGTRSERRIKTSRESFEKHFGNRPSCRIVVEASTESEWVAQVLEGCGHDVVVADPNYTLMYARRDRRVKTDRRDARALAEACRLGAYRPAHRRSAAHRRLYWKVRTRTALVRTRTQHICAIRALLRGWGIAVAGARGVYFLDRLAEASIPPELYELISPLVELIAQVTRLVREIEDELAEVAKTDPVVERLTTAPGVGVLTAAAFVATIDDVRRFRSARQIASYVGLTPGEWSSGDTVRRGGITRRGPRDLRWLLVQAAWSVQRTRSASAQPLRDWWGELAHRRGRAVAAVALARRLARILYAMWRDEEDYRAPRPRAVAA